MQGQPDAGHTRGFSGNGHDCWSVTKAPLVPLVNWERCREKQLTFWMVAKWDCGLSVVEMMRRKHRHMESRICRRPCCNDCHLMMGPRPAASDGRRRSVCPFELRALSLGWKPKGMASYVRGQVRGFATERRVSTLDAWLSDKVIAECRQIKMNLDIQRKG